MSEDLHTYIEPELEARITALVLGEVSEFDVEELEEKISQHPELQIFHRRIEAIHNLLDDTENAKPHDDWKLSNDRRAKLHRAFSQKSAIKTPSLSIVSRAQWRAVIGIAACLVICLMIYSTMTPLDGVRKSSEAQIISYSAPLEEDPFGNNEEITWAPQDRLQQEASKDSKKITRGIKRKPTKPTAMANVIAPRSKSSITVPVPDVDAPEPIVDFGVGEDIEEDFNTELKEKIVSSGKDKKAKEEVIREFIYPTEYEPPELSGSVLGYAQAGEKNAFPVTPATPTSFETRNTGLALELEKAQEVEGFYYSSAYDHTRAKLLSEVDAAWEIAVPAENRKIERELKKPVTQSESFKRNGKQSPDLDKIKHELQDRRNRVAVLRKKLMDSAEKSGVIYMETGTDTDDGKTSGSLVEKAEKEHYLAEKKQEELKHKWRNLTSKREGEDSKELDKIKHEINLGKDRLKKMREIVNAEKSKGTSIARDIQEFNIARKEYQKALEAKNKAQLLYDSQKAKSIKKAKPAPIKPDEILTQAQPFSTFSLNVSDVSFKLAKVALLEKGKWPDAVKVRTEEFINAFDYGDPSPRRGEPVACAIEQSAHPFLQQRNLLRIGMKTAALGRSTPLRLTILLDNSGSMEREDREASVLAALQVLANQLGPQDKISLVSFAHQPRLLADRISGDKAQQLVTLAANTPSEGGTNIEEALKLARKLAKRQHQKGAQSRIVLITDGVANLGNTVPEELSKQIETMRQEGIAFDACGVGAEGLNDDILEAMTRKGDGRYYFLNRPEDADSGFARQLAGALTPAAKNVKVQVAFNPERVEKYKLLGFEKHRLKKEDFRNDRVDAAEMASEEAGNAVYQIKIKPEGEGEIGEVFVRFKDANTGKMVERSWTLTYEPQAHGINEATASMQLAATAAMLGEKLHGTDNGTVNFSQLTGTLNKLRAHYHANSKVQDLIRMCRKVGSGDL